jgi:hypothetical protein
MWKLENAHDEFRDIRCRLLDLFIALKKTLQYQLMDANIPGIVLLHVQELCVF